MRAIKAACCGAVKTDGTLFGGVAIGGDDCGWVTPLGWIEDDGGSGCGSGLMVFAGADWTKLGDMGGTTPPSSLARCAMAFISPRVLDF